MYRKFVPLVSALAFGVIALVASSPAPSLHAAAAPWPWTTSPAAETASYMDVAYGNGLWVAVGGSFTTGKVMMTTDPTCTPAAPATSCWTPVDVGNDVSWYSVTYGEGIFVAVGQGVSTTEKLAMTSPDGVNWTRRSTPASRYPTESAWWLRIEYGGGMFVALANRKPATVNYGVMTSPDGINWTERYTPSYDQCDSTTGYYGMCNQGGGLAYGNGTWILVSDVKSMISTDNGSTWTHMSSLPSVTWPASWVDVEFVNNTFVAIARGTSGDHAAFSTDNGATWSTRLTRLTGGTSIASDGTTLMTVIANGAGIQTDYITLDALKVGSCVARNCWTDNSSIFYPVPAWNDIVYGAGIFLMVSSVSNTVAYTTTPYAPTRDLEVITIDPNDGVGDPTYQSGTSTQALVLPTLTRSGFVLTGWNTKKDGSGSTYANGDNFAFSTTKTDATTLFAQWAAAYPISFNTDGGSAVADSTYATGSTITLPSAPTKAGFTFDGWFTSPTGGTPLGATYTPSGFGALTFYARWTATPAATTTTTVVAPTTTVPRVTTTIAAPANGEVSQTGGGLPKTGGEMNGPLGSALLLLGLGSVAIAMGRRLNHRRN